MTVDVLRGLEVDGVGLTVSLVTSSAVNTAGITPRYHRKIPLFTPIFTIFTVTVIPTTPALETRTVNTLSNIGGAVRNVSIVAEFVRRRIIIMNDNMGNVHIPPTFVESVKRAKQEGVVWGMPESWEKMAHDRLQGRDRS